jgi:glycosyltransferase involved in cell wall biosynthesis
MKILVIQDRLRSGGTERQSILLTRGFREAGHDAHLVTFRPGGDLAASASDLRPTVLQPLDLHLDWFAPGLMKHAVNVVPDIVLCMGRMANCHAGSLQNHLAEKHPRASVICTMRTGKKLPALFRRSLQRVRHVVANSRVSAHILAADYGVPADKISVIHNALVFAPSEDSAVIANNRTLLRARFGATEQTIVLLCIAMFRPEKNQRELIELAAQLPRDRDWQLWLGGEGVARADCEALVAEKKLSDRIKFTGFQADPRPLYHAADLAVLTSRSESLSNFLIEAHAHGLPSVAYEVSGVAECGGIVVPAGDQQEFLAALTPLLTNDTIRRTESEKVRTYAREHFAADRPAAAYLELFTRLVGAR